MSNELSASRIAVWILYGVSVLATSVFLMHGWGVVWAACVLLFWYCFHFYAKQAKFVLGMIMGSWVLGLLFLGPPLFGPSDIDRSGRYQVANEIKQLGLAILNYESWQGHLPPAYKSDTDGKPAHSWRILILPLLESEQGNKIFEQYRMDQSWDSPHNLSVANQLKDPLFGDESDPTLATYKLVSGPGTPFGADTKTELTSELHTSEQITLVEDVASPVLWTKPEDVTPAQVVKIFDAKNNPDGLYKKFGDKWSGTYTRKSWLGFLDGTTQKVFPLADSTQLLPFCLQDQRPSGSVYDLAIGDVATVESHGVDYFPIAALAGLFLLVLMILPSIGPRWREFYEVAGLAISFSFLTGAMLFGFLAVLFGFVTWCA